MPQLRPDTLDAYDSRARIGKLQTPSPSRIPESVTSSTFRRIFAPMTEEEFLVSLEARRLFIHRAEAADRYESLLSWERLLGILASGQLPRDKLTFTQKRKTVSPLLYSDHGKPSVARMELLMKHGASVVARALAGQVPVLGELTAYLASLTRERVSVGAIVTTGSGGALAPHFDNKDIVVLQVEGSKRWKIWEAHVVNPVMGMAAHTPPPDGQPLVFDDELHPGDLLFLPAGSWHCCENGPGRSMHLGIFLEPLTAVHAVHALADRLQQDEVFRQPFARSRITRSQAEAALKDRLHRLVDDLSLEDLIEGLQGERSLDRDG